MSFSGPRLRGPDPAPTMSLQSKRILLVIGGGIAAYKSLDLIRRLQGARRARARRHDPRGAGIHHAAFGRRHRGRAPFTDLFDQTSELDVGHIRAGARDRSRGGGAGDRRPHGQDGARHRRRSRRRGAARHRQEDAAGARDEPANVGASGDAAQSCAAHRRRPTVRRTRTRARWPRAARPASAAWRSPWRSSPRSRTFSRWSRSGSRSRAAGCSSPPAPRASRSIRCASSPTAPRAARATPSRMRRRGPAPTCCWCPVPSKFPIPRA